MPTSTFAIYCYLFAATALYALLLEWFRHLFEPDLTILEVVIGVAICLTAPYADARLNGPLTSEMYEERVRWAFVVGCIPIAIWQVAQFIRARRRLERRIRGVHDDTTRHTPDRAEALAADPGATQGQGD